MEKGSGIRNGERGPNSRYIKKVESIVDWFEVEGGGEVSGSIGRKTSEQERFFGCGSKWRWEGHTDSV